MPARKSEAQRLSFRMMIRLSPEQHDRLSLKAEKAGLAGSSLARDWIVEKLKEPV